MWEDENEGFVACFLIKKGMGFTLTTGKKASLYPDWFSMNLEDEDGSKSGHGRRGYLQEGAWDAIHVVEVHFICLKFVGKNADMKNCSQLTLHFTCLDKHTHAHQKSLSLSFPSVFCSICIN